MAETTMLQVPLWQFFVFCFGAVVTLLGGAWTVGSVMARQFKSGLDEKFEAEAELRAEREKALDQRFTALEKSIRQEGEGWRQVERELLQLKADLPLSYTRREDNIRQEVTFHAKLDALAAKIDALRAGG